MDGGFDSFEREVAVAFCTVWREGCGHPRIVSGEEDAFAVGGDNDVAGLAEGEALGSCVLTREGVGRHERLTISPVGWRRTISPTASLSIA